MKFKDTKYGDLTGQTYKGDIYVHGMDLTSLEGAPKSVKDDFWCYDNPKLTSLKGAPKKVGGDFICSNNPNLKSLEGAPKSVGGGFYCYDNPKLTQSEIDKLVRCDIKGDITVSDGLKAPTKEDYKLYKKLGDRKYWKLKSLKDSL